MDTMMRESRTRQGGLGKTVAVTLAVAVPAFFLGPVLFPIAAEAPTPTSGQLSLFILLAGVESVVFGVGVAFGLFGRPAVQRLVTDPRRATVVHLALTWWLASWWVHDNLHMANGMSLGGLLAIEYAFHVTLIVAAALVAWVVIAEARPSPA